MTIELVSEAIGKADAAGTPELIFTLLTEDVIWTSADDLLAGKLSQLIVLTRAIDRAFEVISHTSSAANFLLKILNSTPDDLLFESVVTAVVNHVASWNNKDLSEFYEVFELMYRGYLRNQNSEGAFIARLALEGLVLLPAYRKDARLLLAAQNILVNRFPTLPLDAHESAHLPVRAIQLLSYCYNFDPQPVIAEKIKELTLAVNLDVASEAHYSLGTVCLFDAFRAENSTELQQSLVEAHNAFDMAVQLQENRTDAEIFLAIIECYLAAVQANRIKLTDSLKLANDKLTQRVVMLSEPEPEEEAIRFHLIQLLVSLKEWVETLSEATRWPATPLAMDTLAMAYTAIREINSANNLVRQVSQTTQQLVLQPQLQSRFLQVQEMKSKLEQIMVAPDWQQFTPPSTVAFYELAMALIQEGESSPQKNEGAARLLPHLAAIETGDPFLAQRLKTLIEAGSDTTELLTEVLNQHSAKTQWLDKFLMSGPARTIFKHLHSGLAEKLNWFSGDLKQFYLEYILASVSKYFIETNQYRVPDGPFLFAETAGGLGQKAKERHLQDDFYNKMHMLPGVKLRYEPEQITPGRPDLAFICSGDIIFPIEVKCEKKDVSRSHINQRYIAQSQHFAAALEQVGFLFVLDITPKSPRLPQMYKLEYCYLDTYDVPGAQYPVWVIVIIFEANRYRPSDHTNLPKTA